MCGIAGFIYRNGNQVRELGMDILRNMANAIVHRGPDADGYWEDSASGIGLAHRRLAIVDLSSAGAQPMISANGRYVVAFNGEIYNHQLLRKELESIDSHHFSWRGHSDTETLLAGFEAWGAEETLKKARGMFAFALWDRKKSELVLARDRLGEKPLYYGWQGDGDHRVFLFGSELSALRKHPAFESVINRDSLVNYVRHNYISAPHSIYKNIYKLLPGHMLVISTADYNAIINCWWSGFDVAENYGGKRFAGTPEEAVDNLEILLKDAIQLQMEADVPLGAFLSGGIDSSTVAALMQAQSSVPIKTFSIGFHEEGYNEAKHAKAVAKHLGTNHTELYVSSSDALSVIPKLPALYSEPFADSSQIPTFLVSKMAREHVTVSLSGDGGDELFCGYTRYQLTSALWGKISAVPMPFRKLLVKTITQIPPNALNKISSFLPINRPGEKLHKGATLLSNDSIKRLYLDMVSVSSDPGSMVLDAEEPSTFLTESEPSLNSLGDVERMMAWDMMGYLPDDILTKVDRAAMGVSLETRVPFLDRNVVEFAWSLPINYKLRNGVTKWPLRQVLYRHVPKELIERPKMGFGAPIDVWLRGPLRDWAEELLSEKRLIDEGYFNASMVRKKWAEHLSGQKNWQYHLWGVLMFQAWLEAQ